MRPACEVDLPDAGAPIAAVLLADDEDAVFALLDPDAVEYVLECPLRYVYSLLPYAL